MKEIIPVPSLGINIEKTKIEAKSRTLDVTWRAEIKDDEITSMAPAAVLELQRQLQELRAYEQAINAGWIPVDSNKSAPWERNVVKAWMAENCVGKFQFGTHHCAFELEADASNFVLTWI